MIVELLVGAGLVMAGATAARALIRRRDRAPDEAPDESGLAAGEDPPEPTKKPRRSRRAVAKRTGPRGLRVGDVLLYEDTELWLAGRLELDEEGLVARLFPTPGALRSEWVAQLDEEARDVAALSVCDEVPAGPVPESLPIGGRRLTLERRGSAEVQPYGEHLPRVEPRGSYTQLSDAGGRVLFVLDFDNAPRIALVGDRIARHTFDLLPGGDLDDEEP